MQHDIIETKSDQRPTRAAANAGPQGGSVSMHAPTLMRQVIPPAATRQEKEPPVRSSDPPVQRVILDDEDKEVPDDVIEKAIAHLPERVQAIVWDIHAAPEFGMTIDQAIEMATAEAAQEEAPEHQGMPAPTHLGAPTSALPGIPIPGHQGMPTSAHPKIPMPGHQAMPTSAHEEADSPSAIKKSEQGGKSAGPDIIILLEEEEDLSGLAVALPPLQVDAKHLEEVSRQLGLQLDNLNKLTAKQWLVNILLNRMKTTEQLINDDYGTGTGKALASKIDQLLIKNGNLARFFFTELKKRMLLLLVGLGSGDELQELVGGILDAIDQGLAAKADQGYLAFRAAKGLERLAVLQASGVQGGLGRQQGKGDEKTFRKEFEDGVALCQSTFPELAKNAVLHNPDQCAGGPFEILWNGIHEAGLLDAREGYRKILPLYQKHLWLVQSYRETPPTKSSGETDELRVGKAEDELLQLEDEMEQAAATYLHEIHIHLGNYDVNSLLGKTWMEPVPHSKLINRVDILLDHVLTLSLKDLDRTRLHVVMEAVSEEETISGKAGSFPDVLSSRKLPKPQAPRKGGRKAKTVGEKIEAGKEKLKGPKQITLEDLTYRQEKATGEEGAKEKEKAVGPAMSFMEAVHQHFTITPIDGNGLACYIRAIVTGTPGADEHQIENLVDAISDHLAHIGIRSPNQMIDAGGLAAAEVRHALSQLTGLALTPRVEIVIRDPRGGYARFMANDGDYDVILLHSGAHFDLLTERNDLL